MYHLSDACEIEAFCSIFDGENRPGKVTFFKKRTISFYTALASKLSGGWRLKLYSIKARSILIESHPFFIRFNIQKSCNYIQFKPPAMHNYIAV